MIYVVIELDFEGNYADTQVYVDFLDAREHADIVFRAGGSAEICARNLK